MSETTKTPLISSEISGIWNAYTGETLLSCVFKYFSNRVDDEETRAILNYTLDLTNNRINLLTNIFTQEKLPIPIGLSDKDVDINAPRLFTDAFYLQYLTYTSRMAIRVYSNILIHISRTDIRDYFSQFILESTDLYNKIADICLTKGIFIKAPHVEVPKEVQYVESQNIVLNLFKKKRPLLTDEVTHIFSNINDTVVRRAFITGFYQTCKDKEISDYISDVLALSADHNSGFSSLLIDEDIPIPGSPDSYVTDSTISPFSSKFILTKLMIMYKIKIGSLGAALTDINRTDLRTMFSKYLNDCNNYAEDAASILIDRGWMEQPPQAINHKNLLEV